MRVAEQEQSAVVVAYAAEAAAGVRNERAAFARAESGKRLVARAREARAFEARAAAAATAARDEGHERSAMGGEDIRTIATRRVAARERAKKQNAHKAAALAEARTANLRRLANSALSTPQLLAACAPEDHAALVEMLVSSGALAASEEA